MDPTEVVVMARANVRGQLVDAAMSRFLEHGFNGTGVKDITDQAGVPKGSFYNHFESKEALGVELVRLYASAQHVEMLDDTSIAPIQRLRAHFGFLADAGMAGDYGRGCMFGNFGVELSGQSESIRRQVESGLDAWSERVAALLAEAGALGQLHSPLEDETLGRFIVGAWQGAVLRAKVTKTRAPLDDFFQVFDVLTT
jgi:TetR/AcrR family transcriptional regulator, transcriptional repressor for nem operon